MTARAYVRPDILGRGANIVISPAEDRVLVWHPLEIRETSDQYREAARDEELFLPDDSARALYEALADFYGHAGHDIRSLRKDYDAERRRVDQFIGHLIKDGRQ
jgi:hypothetical protein